MNHHTSHQALTHAVQRAVDAGLLPLGAQAAEPETRPWPVLLLVALGAWLAAVPLMVAVALLLGDFIQGGVGPYAVGALMVTGALVVLRAQAVPVFVEQLALSALLAGGGALGMGLFRDLSDPLAAAWLCVLALAVAVVVPRAWLRLLLGCAAAVFSALACLQNTGGDGPFAQQFGAQSRLWVALHLLLLVWICAGAAQAHLRPAWRAALEPLRAGWLLVALAGLAWWSGLTMLVGASLGGTVNGGLAGGVARGAWSLFRSQGVPMQGMSLLLTLAAAALLARRWPTLRQPWCAAAGLVLALLALLMPALGAVLLALALSVSAARGALASAAGLAAAWIVGAAYYSLAWTLQDKASALVVAGAALGALAWWAGRASVLARSAPAPAPGPAPAPAPSASAHAPALAAASPSSRAVAWGALSVLAVLAVVNFGIWQKQQLIQHGQAVFVALAPADPRSLMQGDYMTLRFELPSEVREPAQGLLRSQRPRLRLQRNEQGVATLRSWDPSEALLPGELTLELTPKAGQWVLVTDAWFFAEGQAQRWQAARYGEFRVDGQGRALLVGLRGDQLQPL